MSPITVSSTVYAKEKFGDQDSYKNSGQQQKISINLIFAANMYFVMFLFQIKWTDIK